MTDGPQRCALTGCNENVEAPADGGPPRLYCTPAHRAAARKMRHAARMEAEKTTDRVAAAPPPPPVPAVPPALAAPQPPAAGPVTPPAEEELPADPAADKRWSPVAAWTTSRISLPQGEAARRGTKQRVLVSSPFRNTRKGKMDTPLRRRAIASLAVASLVAGGSGYVITQTAIPVTPVSPLAQPPVEPAAVMEPDVWASQAEVVLASIDKQLEVVAQTEATWQQAPETSRNQPTSDVRALADRKALLEQQRATLTSQLGALRALPEVTVDLTAAQTELDAIEQALNTPASTTSSPDQAEAVRLLTEQRDLRRQQRDHNAQALTTLRDGVQQALRTPLPDESDRTAPIAERVMALARQQDDQDRNESQGRDSGQDPDPLASEYRESPPATQRRESQGQERRDVGVTAPPDPERPVLASVLSLGDSGRDNSSDRDSGPERNSDPDREGSGSDRDGESADGPVERVAGATVDTVSRILPGDDSGSSDDDSDRSDSDRSDSDRGDSGQGDDRSSERSDDSDDDSDRGPVRSVVENVSDVTGSLLGGGDRSDRDDDSDNRSKPAGKAERSRSQNSDDSRSSSDGRDRDRDERSSDGSSERGGEKEDGEKRGKPSGKAERAKSKAEAQLRETARHVADAVRERVESSDKESSRESSKDRSSRSGDSDRSEKSDRSDKKSDDGEKSSKKKDSDGKDSDKEGSDDKSSDKKDSDSKSDKQESKEERSGGDSDSDSDSGDEGSGSSSDD